MLGFRPESIPQIRLVEQASLVPYHRNARTHSAKQVEQLEALLLSYGWTNAILVDDMGIVAGHGRSMAAERIYKRGEQIKFPNGTPIPIGYVPVIDCAGWSPEQRKAYIIADNRSAMSAGWDMDLLKLELKDLELAEFDLTLTAFDEDELSELLAVDLAPDGDADPDAVPEPPELPVTVLGDTWILGPHKVRCGDSTCLEDWDALMQGERADACFTDPPYNVDLGRKNKLMDGAVGGKRFATGAISNDKMSPDEFRDLISGAYASLFANMKPGATIYVAHSDKAGDVFRVEFEKAGFHFSQGLVWNKGQHVLGMADFQPSHEPILYGWKSGSRHRWYGGRKQRTVLEAGDGGMITKLEDGRFAISIGDTVMIIAGDVTIEESPSTVIFEPKPAASGLHPSTKPVNLIEKLLKNSARGGDLVVDAFGGSGSTLIAADRLGMSARLMELEPKYVDVIIQRWQDFTGRRAVHAATGELFPGPDEPRQAPQSEPPSTDIF
jgi:DNA modification methylase